MARPEQSIVEKIGYYRSMADTFTKIQYYTTIQCNAYSAIQYNRGKNGEIIFIRRAQLVSI